MRALSAPLAAPLALALLPTPLLAAPPVQRIQEALVRGEAALLSVQWDLGPEGAERRRLVVREGAAQLQRCPAAGACADLGARTPLTPGQRERLLSGLRAAGLGALRSAGPGDAPPDRALTLALPGAAAVSFRLARTEWPAPPGAESLAAFLDDLLGGLERAAAARPPLPVPRTIAELAGVRLKLHLRPQERPGGTLLIERGVARVTPEEGSRPRAPRPGPFERPLSEAEQTALVAALQAADLDRLEGAVPRRAAPAIGDGDGRLATLHLLPLLDGEGGAAGQPRGWERFLADLLRSPARPLLDQLLGILLATPPPPPPRSLRDVIGRDDLVLSWSGGGAAVTVRLGELASAPREELRRAFVVAGPYLGGLGRGGERTLEISAPVGARDHVVGTYGASLAAWRRGRTARLAELLEQRLGKEP